MEASPRQVPQSPDSLAGGWKYIFFLSLLAGSYPAPVLPFSVLCLTHTSLVIQTLAPTPAGTCTVRWGPAIHHLHPRGTVTLAGEQAEALPLRTCLSVRGWGP